MHLRICHFSVCDRRDVCLGRRYGDRYAGRNSRASAHARLFQGPSPIKHIIYIIKENRTYDQVFGDLERAGDGTPADGDPRLAIFGTGEAARLPGGAPQNITPNHRARHCVRAAGPLLRKRRSKPRWAQLVYCGFLKRLRR